MLYLHSLFLGLNAKASPCSLLVISFFPLARLFAEAAFLGFTMFGFFFGCQLVHIEMGVYLGSIVLVTILDNAVEEIRSSIFTTIQLQVVRFTICSRNG